MGDDESIRVVGICGSLRPNGWTLAALKIALAGAKERGATAELLDLRDYNLPFCAGGDPDAIQGNAGVQRLRQKVSEASGIILATPNYHGSLSGVLKNALDLMSMREFEGKVVGLIGVSGGRMGGTFTLNTLRAIGRTLHAWVIPSEAWIYNADSAFTEDGHIKDPNSEQRVRDVGRKIARLTRMLASKEARELLHLWEDDEAVTPSLDNSNEGGDNDNR
ncbi:MAG TPA: NAD(P)H-dependent oxidoreductase [Candidatus Binatia bacterium]|nr:NAD(P)H-dependent oxidoreductase [Candidatus Binatia bacterium]